MLNPENKRKLSTASHLIDEAVKVGLASLEKHPTANYGFEGFIFLNLLERFTFHLESANILLKTFEVNPRVESAMGIILRVCLLDFMTVTYLSTYTADIKSPGESAMKKELEKQIEILMCDQVNNTLKYLKRGKDCGLIKKEDYKAAVEGTWHTYKVFFTEEAGDLEQPEKNLIQKDFVSPKKMFMRIHHHDLVKKFSEVYDLYTYYSKYEHFGIMTHQLQRMGPDEQFGSVLAAMKYALRGMGATASWLNFPVGKLGSELATLQKISEGFDPL